MYLVISARCSLHSNPFTGYLAIVFCLVPDKCVAYVMPSLQKKWSSKYRPTRSVFTWQKFVFGCIWTKATWRCLLFGWFWIAETQIQGRWKRFGRCGHGRPTFWEMLTSYGGRARTRNTLITIVSRSHAFSEKTRLREARATKKGKQLKVRTLADDYIVWIFRRLRKYSGNVQTPLNTS